MKTVATFKKGMGLGTHGDGEKNNRSEDRTKGLNTLSYLNLHRSFQVGLITVFSSNIPGDTGPF